MNVRNITLALILTALALPSVAHAQGKPVQRERCFVVMLKAWCPGIESVNSSDTKQCVKKHWGEMGGYCQNAYSDFKP